MNWSVGRKIMAGYVLALVVIVVIGVMTYLSTVKFTEIVSMRRQLHEAIVHFEALLSDLKDAESGERGFVITGQDEYLEPYRDASQSVFRHLDTVRRLPAIDARYKDSSGRIGAEHRGSSQTDARSHRDPEGRGPGDATRPNSKSRRVSASTAWTRSARSSGLCRNRNRNGLRQRSQEADANATFTEAIILGGILLAIVLFGLAGALTSRGISRPLERGHQRAH